MNFNCSIDLIIKRLEICLGAVADGCKAHNESTLLSGGFDRWLFVSGGRFPACTFGTLPPETYGMSIARRIGGIVEFICNTISPDY